MNSMSFLSSALKSKSASGAGKAIKDAIAAGKPSKGSGLATTAGECIGRGISQR